ncbi:MAG: thioredoxin-disulfide reductase [Treponema sp.]
MKPDYDIIIVGAGTAGMAAAQYAGRSNLTSMVFEEKAPGGQAVLIDSLENYPGIVEPIDGFTFSDNMRKQAVAFGAAFMSEKVHSIVKNPDQTFAVSTAAKTYTAWAVIFATGAEHRSLNVKGEKELQGKGVSYCATCDGPFFRNKRIVVVGGGDAACDEALFLSRLTDTVTMVHRRDAFRAQKALVSRTLSNPHIRVAFNTTVQEIKGADHVSSVILQDVLTKETREFACDAVFFFVGMEPQTALLPDVQKDGTGYIITDEKMQTSIEGLYAAGDVRAKPFRQVVTAAADGAIAAHEAAAYIDSLNR